MIRHRREGHPDTLTFVACVGSLVEAQGKFADAETYYSEALEGRRHRLGDKHPDRFASALCLSTLRAAS